MSLSFEKILDFSFFNSELLKWIGIQEIGRLKCTSKKIQSKLTIQNIRPLLEENLTFRSLIFRNQLDIIEQIIPFKFNKRKHKFPKQVLATLFNKAASEGKLNLINILISEEYRPIFGYIEFVSCARLAAKNGHIEIAKMIMAKIDFFFEMGIIQQEKLSTQLWRNVSWNELSEIAYSRTDREFTKWLLKHSQSADEEERRKLLEEIEKVSSLLNTQNESTTKETTQNWLSYLYFLSTMFEKTSKPFISIKSMMEGDFKNNALENLKSIAKFFRFLPGKLILNESQYVPQDLRKNQIPFFSLAWYAFIDDFEKFKETAFTKLKETPNWPLESPLPDSPFYIVVVLMLERKLSTKYFEFCCNSCLPTTIPKPEWSNYAAYEIEKCLKVFIEAKRLDLVEQILKFSKEIDIKFEATFAKNVIIMAFDDLKNLKWIIEKLKHYVDFSSQYFPNIVFPNTQAFKIVLEASVPLTFRSLSSLFRQYVFYDLDLCKMMLRHEPFRKAFNPDHNWSELVQFCLEQGDEELLRVAFSMQLEFPTNFSLRLFTTVFEDMKKRSKITNMEAILEVSTLWLPKLKEIEKARNAKGFEFE